MSIDKQLERIAREEGIKNFADIYDQPTFEETNKEFKNIRPNSKENVSEKKLTEEFKACLHKTREFCAELSDEFSLKFLSLLKQRCKEKKISQKMIDHLLEKKFDLPKFTISYGKEANELLYDFGLNMETDNQFLLLTFQLPKPLAKFWWKGGNDSWGDSAEDVENRVIEWGHFYRELMHEVWNMQGYYENEKGLDFRRLNDIGEHDPKKFYYVWKISRWE